MKPRKVVVVGGGIIGLAISWELSQRGVQVTLLDREEMGRATSWAGIGILPPPQIGAQCDPVEQLRALSHQQYPDWVRQLESRSRIDVELIPSGGIYIARHASHAAVVRATARQLIDDGVEVETLSAAALVHWEPRLKTVAEHVLAAYRLPGEMHVRTPRLLEALQVACSLGGVELRTHVELLEIEGSPDQNVVSLVTSSGSFHADAVCLAGGTWTTKWLERLGSTLPIEPWRGQILLLKTDSRWLNHVVNEGHRYLVPRRDGHLIVGSTVEDVGFCCSTTTTAIEELHHFAAELLPDLRQLKPIQAWAGLRPRTPDDRPYLGRVPGFSRLYVAAGHYRSGIHLAPVTARVLAELIIDGESTFDLLPFRLNR